jgi:thymidylate synthase (FAD)
MASPGNTHLRLSTYTEAYRKIDLHNLLHFLQLRMGPHSQEEIRAHATTIGGQMVAKWVPLVWEAFVTTDYAIQWSRLEIEIVATLIAGAADRAWEWRPTRVSSVRTNMVKRFRIEEGAEPVET